eukprot:COSAG01_NODE_1902_length_8963_cov_29.997405_4_plen_106_part_00
MCASEFLCTLIESDASQAGQQQQQQPAAAAATLCRQISPRSASSSAQRASGQDSPRCWLAAWLWQLSYCSAAVATSCMYSCNRQIVGAAGGRADAAVHCTSSYAA